MEIMPEPRGCQVDPVTDPPYPNYFEGFKDEKDYCEKLIGWADQVANGYKDLYDWCFKSDYYLDKACILGGFTFGTYYKPTNVLRLFMYFSNYSEAEKIFKTITDNFSKCNGMDNVFQEGSTGRDYWTDAVVLRELKTWREIKTSGKKNSVKFQLIHKATEDDYPAQGEVGYYIYYETRLE